MKQPESFPFEIADLIRRFLVEDISPEELEKLEAWAAENPDHQLQWELIKDPDYLEGRLKRRKAIDSGASWKAVARSTYGNSLGDVFPYRKALRYAAILLPFLLIGGIWWYRDASGSREHSSRHPGLAEGTVVKRRAPAATLVMGSGQTINLKDSVRESLTEADGTHVSNQGSTLSYSQGETTKGQTLFNTLVTPRAGEYKLRLSDGTLVWLNAETSLRFPVQFSGRERKVTLTGEAYFEVAKDPLHPFVVAAGHTSVKVLGTQFDVSSYEEDQDQRVVLVEGSVAVGKIPEDERSGMQEVLLKPGYEAVVNSAENVAVKKANVSDALAWKDGIFLFDGETLAQLMRKLSRWYDVDVRFAAGVDTLSHFSGRIQKYDNISSILNLIELTGTIHCTLKGRELYIFPEDQTENN